MDENEMNEMDEDIIVFEDEDGNKYNFIVVDYMFYNGEESEDEKQECIVCRIVTETEDDGEESETFELVEDEEMANKLVEIFNTKLTEEEKEDN